MDDLLSKRHKVKCLVRSAEAEKTWRSKGFEVVRGDKTMPETLKDVLRSDDFVIHLVGIIAERGKATFKSIHVEGTANLVEEAKRARAKHFFYQSALGIPGRTISGQRPKQRR
jgi:NADH dehydrogenase